jgi:hypothetical protein
MREIGCDVALSAARGDRITENPPSQGADPMGRLVLAAARCDEVR